MSKQLLHIYEQFFRFYIINLASFHDKHKILS